jgi:hypothetical protein
VPESGRAELVGTDGDVPTYETSMTTARDVLANHIGGDQPYNLADAAIIALYREGYEVVQGPYDPDAELLTDLNTALDLVETSTVLNFVNDEPKARWAALRTDLLHRHGRMPCDDENCEINHDR